MYVGKPEVFNAPTVHLDEVETIAPGTTVLATNAGVRRAERGNPHNGAVAWGVQYHPEYPLREIAAIVRRIGPRLIDEGFFLDTAEIASFAGDLDTLDRDPDDKRLVVALRHQQERAGQEAAHRRGRQLARIPGAADARQARAGLRMDFKDRHVVVTGGTGALGRAVVGALVEAGAHCHVSYMIEAEAQGLSAHRTNVTLHAGRRSRRRGRRWRSFYGAVPKLWASIHLAGGFAMNADRRDRHGRAAGSRSTAISSAAFCAAARRSARMAQERRRAHRQRRARPALEPRSGAGMVAYTASKAAVVALTVALAEEVAKDGILVNAVAPSIMDTPANRKAMPNADHASWPKVEEVAATILLSRLAAEHGHPRRRRAGVRQDLSETPRVSQMIWQTSSKPKRWSCFGKVEGSPWPRQHRKFDLKRPSGKNAASTTSFLKPDIGPQSSPIARAASIR